MKYFGNILINKIIETQPGVWETKSIKVKRKYNVITTRLQRATSNTINSTLSYSTTITVAADKELNDNLYDIAGVEYNHQMWKVSSIAKKDKNIQLILGELCKNQ